MIKHFCDECNKELTAEEVRFSLDMLGKELCQEHAAKKIKDHNYIWKAVKKNAQYFPPAD
jgi:hypothetical protein